MTCTSTQSESIDAVLRLLSDSCRRTLLRVLVTGPDEKSVDEVVDQIVAESTVDRRTSPDRSRITTALHHKHLPKLDDYDIVDYDPGRNSISYRQCDDLEALLDSVDELEGDTA